MLRENPHALDGWVCAQCGGRRRVATRRPQRVSVVQQRIPLTLVTSRAQAIDISKYETPFIGFELEMNRLSCDRAKQLLGFDGRIGKTNGVNSKTVTKNLGDGGKVEFLMDYNFYNELPIVAQIYPDGTVETEVVTRPVPLNQLHRVKQVHDTLRTAGADLWAGGNAGTHMTILLNHHQAHSSYDEAVVRNVIQIARIWYPELIQAFGGNGSRTRGLGFRCLPNSTDRDSLNTQHYCAVNVKRLRGGQIWALEIRFPDGSNNWTVLEKQARFWSAVIRQSAIISQWGQIEFTQERWQTICNWVNNGTATNQLPVQLVEILQGSLEFFKYVVNDNTEQEREKLTQALRGG